MGLCVQVEFTWMWRAPLGSRECTEGDRAVCALSGVCAERGRGRGVSATTGAGTPESSFASPSAPPPVPLTSSSLSLPPSAGWLESISGCCRCTAEWSVMG